MKGPWFTLANESPPVQWIRIVGLQRELRSAQGIGSRLAGEHAPIEVGHQLLSLLVRYFPETHHERLCSREHEGSAQSEDAFARLDLAQPGLARRESDELGPQQIHSRNVLGVQEGVFGF